MGFKSFMCPSGINDFPNVDAEAISAALPFLKKAGVPFFVHAELVSDIPQSQVGSSARLTHSVRETFCRCCRTCLKIRVVSFLGGSSAWVR